MCHNLERSITPYPIGSHIHGIKILLGNWQMFHFEMAKYLLEVLRSIFKK